MRPFITATLQFLLNLFILDAQTIPNTDANDGQFTQIREQTNKSMAVQALRKNMASPYRFSMDRVCAEFINHQSIRTSMSALSTQIWRKRVMNNEYVTFGNAFCVPLDVCEICRMARDSLFIAQNSILHYHYDNVDIHTTLSTRNDNGENNNNNSSKQMASIN